MNQSLINSNPELSLETSDLMPARFFSEIEQGEPGRNPEFTARRLFSKKPEKYRQIVALIAEGLGVDRIARLAGCSVHTVLAIRENERGAVAGEKERIADIARHGARLAVEKIVEDLSSPARRDKITAKDAAIVAGVLIDKSELLSGGATARIEHTAPAAPPAHDDFNAWLESGPAPIDIEDDSTRFGGEKSEQKAGLLGLGEPGGAQEGYQGSDKAPGSEQPAGDQAPEKGET